MIPTLEEILEFEKSLSLLTDDFESTSPVETSFHQIQISNTEWSRCVMTEINMEDV